MTHLAACTAYFSPLGLLTRTAAYSLLPLTARGSDGWGPGGDRALPWLRQPPKVRAQRGIERMPVASLGLAAYRSGQSEQQMPAMGCLQPLGMRCWVHAPAPAAFGKGHAACQCQAAPLLYMQSWSDARLEATAAHNMWASSLTRLCARRWHRRKASCQCCFQPPEQRCGTQDFVESLHTRSKSLVSVRAPRTAP